MGKNTASSAKRTPLVAVLLLLALALFSMPVRVQAEPYIALREGLKCDFCHVNKTGGGKRTPAFASTAESYLHPFPVPEPLDAEARQLVGQLDGRLSLGANLRFSNSTLFREDPDAQGLVSRDKLFRPLEANDFAIDRGLVYLQADLIRDRLIFYLDESFAPGPPTNRETFALLNGPLPWGGYIKAGRFFAPYGLRIQDDEAFIRAKTGFNFNDFSEGVELGLSTGKLFFAAALVNSDDSIGNDSEKQLSANGYYLTHLDRFLKTLMLGASLAHNPSLDRDLYGLYLGVSFWRLTLLAEADLIADQLSGQGDIERLAAYLELNWLVRDEINLKFAYDYFDPDDSLDEDHRQRLSLGLESFVGENLQARLIYRNVNDIPQNSSGNFNELIAEIHLFF